MRFAIAAVLLLGCASDQVDLTGTYRVDTAVGSMPCGTDASITFPAFVRFEKMDFIGNSFFAYDGCTDETATVCTSIGGLIGGGFFEPQANGWLGRSSFSSGGGSSPCTLGIIRQTATLHATALEIEVSSFEDEALGLSEAECSPDEAEKRGMAMPCIEHSLVDATHL